MAESFYDLYCLEVLKNEKLEKELKQVKASNKSLLKRIKYLEQNQDQIVERAVDKATRKLREEIVELKKQIEQLRSVLNNDSTNSGIPTSMTPINKQKHIPNSRVKTGNRKGAQKGHVKHDLPAFSVEEITHTVDHKVSECPQCGSDMDATGETVFKDEYDFDVVVKKIRHRFIETRCAGCGCVTRMDIPSNLKEENQYGYGVQALALTLMNEGYVSMARTKEIIAGLTKNEIDLSVGYIAKLQKRLDTCLKGFNEELKRAVIQLSVIHWDDTVIAVDKQRSCLRFYGNDKFAYYRAHEKKDKVGLDEDQILMSLDSDTYVVHDHNKVNYNAEYEFQNVECCVHLLRDLKKVVDNLGHEWPKHMIELLLKANHEQNQGDEIDAEYIGLCYDQYVCEGDIENTEDEDKYYAGDEKTLLKRLKEYKKNYLMWTCNKKIPFSNNIAERSLRSSKTKMKVSGQFSTIANAEYFAGIKSYIETGHRHGMNSMVLISRALAGNPVSLDEMKKYDKDYNY